MYFCLEEETAKLPVFLFLYMKNYKTPNGQIVFFVLNEEILQNSLQVGISKVVLVGKMVLISNTIALAARVYQSV